MLFRMSRILPVIGVMLGYGVLSLTPAAAALQSLQVGMEAPDFALRTMSAEPRSFREVKGEKLTIVVFWSTWSAKSETVLARLQQLHERYKGQGLAIIAVNADEPKLSGAALAGIEAVKARLKIGFPMLLDEGLVAFRDYGVIALPTTVIMDKERVIRYELPGYPLVGSEALVDFVTASIEGKQPPVVAAKTGHQPDRIALRFYNMGKTTLKSKSIAETADLWFKKAIAADPAFVLPHLSLGTMYLQRGEAALAKAEFREALAREPANPIALCESGLILVNEGKVTEGLALFEAARKGDDSFPPCYTYAGYAYGKEGKLAEALKMFAEAEKANPRDYTVFVYKGKVFEELKDRKQALEAYKKALEIILNRD